MPTKSPQRKPTKSPSAPQKSEARRPPTIAFERFRVPEQATGPAPGTYAHVAAIAAEEADTEIYGDFNQRVHRLIDAEWHDDEVPRELLRLEEARTAPKSLRARIERVQEYVDEQVRQIRDEQAAFMADPNRDFRTLYVATAWAFQHAISIARMARRAQPPSVSDFIHAEARLGTTIELARSLLTREDVRHEYAERWPEEPRGFGWITGGSALDVAHRFAQALWVEVIANQHETWGTRDGLVVSPEPDPRLAAWRDRSLQGVRERTLTDDYLTTGPIIMREAGLLALQMTAEWRKASEAPAGARRDGPHWITDHGILYFDGDVVATIDARAERLRAILDAFEGSCWPATVNNPFVATSESRKNARRDAIRDLNKIVRPRIEFTAEGNGTMIGWTCGDKPLRRLYTPTR